MKIIQIASDREVGVWYFDKQEKKLIKINMETMQDINGMGNLPITAIVIGVSSILLGITSYLTSIRLYMDKLSLALIIGIILFVSYMYARHYLKKVAVTVKSVGKRYDLTWEIMSYIAGAGKKGYIALSKMLILAAIAGFGCLYYYDKDREIKALIVGIILIGYLFSGLIMLHPIQKLFFWIKVKKYISHRDKGNHISQIDNTGNRIEAFENEE